MAHPTHERGHHTEDATHWLHTLCTSPSHMRPAGTAQRCCLPGALASRVRAPEASSCLLDEIDCHLDPLSPWTHASFSMHVTSSERPGWPWSGEPSRLPSRFGRACHLAQQSRCGGPPVICVGTHWEPTKWSHQEPSMPIVIASSTMWQESCQPPHQENSILCPCGCQTDLFTVVRLS